MMTMKNILGNMSRNCLFELESQVQNNFVCWNKKLNSGIPWSGSINDERPFPIFDRVFQSNLWFCRVRNTNAWGVRFIWGSYELFFLLSTNLALHYVEFSTYYYHFYWVPLEQSRQNIFFWNSIFLFFGKELWRSADTARAIDWHHIAFLFSLKMYPSTSCVTAQFISVRR